MEGEYQYQGKLDKELEEWFYPRWSQTGRSFFSDEEKEESIQIKCLDPQDAIISNQASEGEIYTMVVVKWSDKVEGLVDNIDNHL